METKGHLISDEQLQEYEEMLERRQNVSKDLIISIQRFNGWGDSHTEMDHFRIYFKTDEDINIDKLYKKHFIDAFRANEDNLKWHQGQYDSKRKMLEDLKEELSNSPSIWSFFKTRKLIKNKLKEI